jgi:CO/xanthine dehydrogenase FAD-binding subunit
VGAYARPIALTAALDLLDGGVRAGRPPVIVAGATDHYPARVGRVMDEDVLDVSGLAGMRGIGPIAGGWWIPAGATWTELVEAPLPSAFDGLKLAARAVGGLQIQNRGTVVGNVCNASPAADGLPNLLALDAIVELASTRGTRRLPIGEFVTGNRTTRREPDELVTGVFVPDPLAGGRGAEGGNKSGGEALSTFVKLGSRAYLVISIVMVAAVIVRDEGGRISSARIAVGACSPVARRLPGLEAALLGEDLRPGIADLALELHLAPLAPIDDVRGSAVYRRGAAMVLVRRALEELAAGTSRVAR